MNQRGMPPCPHCARGGTVWQLTDFFAFSRDRRDAEYSRPVGLLDAPCCAPAAPLARALHPPLRPGKLYAVGCFSIAVTAFFTSVPLGLLTSFCASIVLTGPRILPEQAYPTIWTICFFASLIGVAAWLRRAEARYKRDYPRWEAAWERWRTLYYCCHCDQVFTPGRGQPMPTAQLPAFLYEAAPAPSLDRASNRAGG